MCCDEELIFAECMRQARSPAPTKATEVPQRRRALVMCHPSGGGGDVETHGESLRHNEHGQCVEIYGVNVAAALTTP